jgi:hypothetical protein
MEAISMKLGIERWGCVLVVMSAVWLAPRPAAAGIGACGNIDVEARAECTVVPPGAQCEAMCEPVAVRAACSVMLAAECRGGCDELPSVDCSASCQADCSAKCEVDPGKFDCKASCEADCSGSCSGQCEANSDSASCEAACEGSCNASCDSHCDVELPEADCEGRCEASCEGSCEVDPNLDCQIDCQAKGKAECEVDVQGGCEVDCDTQEGALFCDGQYIDHGNNLDECVAALKAALDVKVSGYASGESGCTDEDGCMATGRAGGKVSSDCAVAQPGTHRRPGALMLLGIGWVLALGVWRRGSRRKAGR